MDDGVEPKDLVDAAHGAAAAIAGGDSPRLSAGWSRAAVILGNDALVAARPASAAQLANACKAAGFDIVVPPSWGDELVAAAYLAQLAHVGDRVAIACTCPRVRSAIACEKPEAAPRQIAVASPPVAAARYLRLRYGDSILVTYVGDCPSGDDAAIDARFSPAGFFASLQRQEISITSQPNAFSRADADRWQRHLSVPGGLPALRWLARRPVDRVLREVDVSAVASGGWPEARSNMLVDLADAVACACGGNRAVVEEAEPIRSTVAVVVAPPELDLGSAPSPPRSRLTTVARPRAEPAIEPMPAPVAPPVAPTAATSTIARAPDAVATRTTRLSSTRRHQERSAAAERTERRYRSAALVFLPAIVIGAATALGIGAYTAASTNRTQAAAAAGELTPPSTDALVRAVDSVQNQSAPTIDSIPADTTDSTGVGLPAADSVHLGSTPRGDSAAAPADSLAPNRPRRSREPEVVPGWLPQGEKAWTPADSNRTRKRDSSTVAPKAKPDTVPPA